MDPDVEIVLNSIPKPNSRLGNIFSFCTADKGQQSRESISIHDQIMDFNK